MSGGILEVIESAMDEQGISIKSLAPLVGKEYSTLKRELNEFDPGAKLGVETLIPLIRTVGPAPLEFIAAACGYTVRPVSGAPDAPSMAEECLQGFTAVARYIEAANAGQRYTDLSPKLAAAIKELEDVFVRARDRDELASAEVRGRQ
ncbi:helix-turn-helix domain-containing protein [Nitratidesulfovibrio sp. 1201_IL3209]|uniref:helix-turn-helix domain-containing protein n=1 Tax=Nitratidesulfovibrio sp. 1201_IL3209 TaxID=3084053 RepID=UPI002FD94DCF